MFLPKGECERLQQELEQAYEQAAIDKVQRLLERKAMAADRHHEMAREIQQETLQEREAQRGMR
jgi:hypothetical protein